MKKRLSVLFAGLALLCMNGLARAALVTIGTATYGGSDYKLIWDDDNNGNSVIWLDYSEYPDTWQRQMDWAAGLDSAITSYNLNPGYSVTWTDPAWRLPATVDGLGVYGYEGDPDHDGVYTYTYGYNLANSEMGHLFYTELGNLGYVATDGTQPQPGWGLQNTGDFDHLITSFDGYWSGTEYAPNLDGAWLFSMYNGEQNANPKYVPFYGLALRGGQVSAVPIPGAVWLLSSGLTCLLFLGHRK